MLLWYGSYLENKNKCDSNMRIRKTITIEPEHEEWIKDNRICLSKFVQRKIEEEMKKRK